MRLSTFIKNNMESILQEWENFARSIQPPHRSMDASELRDHAKEMLEEIAAELATADAEGSKTSEAPEIPGSRASELHAETRLISGFNIEQLVAEYRALRASVLRLWLRRDKTATWFEVDDMHSFNEAIDRSLAESVARYSQIVSRSRDIFLGILGHDLRTPLQSLSMGASYLMRYESADSNLIQLGSRMFNSTSRMTQILDKLLDFTASRIGGGISFSPTVGDLAFLSEQIANEFRFSHPTRIIKTECSGDATGTWDMPRMGQVYQNLIGNALQYGDGESPVSVLTHGAQDRVTIAVHNDGDPIPNEKLENLFNPLYRHARPEAGEAGRKNLGLGLYIVREIVIAHNGTIHVASSEEAGTSFTISLPKKPS